MVKLVTRLGRGRGRGCPSGTVRLFKGLDLLCGGSLDRTRACERGGHGIEEALREEFLWGEMCLELPLCGCVSEYE